MLYTLIVPCFNEEKCIPSFFEAATTALSALEERCEIVFVDDGSLDNTLAALKRLIGDAPKDGISFSIISFSRNFGKEAAILAGLEHSRGDYIGIIDADMQQDPQISVEMLDFLINNPEFDCVAAVQEKRKDSALIRVLKNGFYGLFNLVTDIDIHSNASDFRVFTRQIAETLMSMPEYHRFSKGLFSWIGYKTHYITYRANSRVAGESTWSTKGLFKYAFSGMTAFSVKPLKIAMGLGIIISLCAIMYFIITLVSTVINGSEIPGYPTLVCILLLASGVQLFSMGIIGEYIGLAYIEGKHRPIYIAKEITSFNAAEDPSDANAQ